jgi:hypothetical protein
MPRAERRALLEEYFGYYKKLIEQSPAALNQKVSRKVFASLLDSIGELLLKESASAAQEAGPLRDFLDKNPLPPILADKLSVEFRVFCLALNALKQWVAAEQAATDRYLLGAAARDECRAIATTCVLSGELLTGANTDLHHPVRDGRPPIPLSKKAHAGLEGQLASVKRFRGNADNGTPSGINTVVAYRSTRLLFRADVIEPLTQSDRFQVETQVGTFEMSKADFYSSFANVVASESYQTDGAYSYSKVPKKALQYRLESPMGPKAEEK